MCDSDNILEAARAIRPYLADLLGVDAEAIDRQVAKLLSDAKSGQQVNNQILELLSSFNPTREWMAEFLKDNLPPQVTSSYRSYYRRPPGDPNPPQTVRYVCPEGDFIVYGEPVPPTCPTHGLLLIREK